jgi:predicted ATPase
VVTFLFTDIEGSTRRWEADAAAMRAALMAHDEVLRSSIEGHDGFLFSHTGDGVVAAFASPRSAVDAAVAAQRALELPVRMGIASGEAELRDGDYFGTVLNRAARVMAAGHGGQVLLADSTVVLLSGVELINLGPRRLRDVPMPGGVFQVQAAELRAEFPPLRALDTTPGNLRPATTSLIGRESEVAEIEAAVKAHRLVTLTGVGGVGKTRMALEVAAHLADEFPDGVWVFELAAVTDPAAVPDAVAAVLGITQQPGKTVSESVAAALEGRVRLLVFDNCEHVLVAAADLIEAMLAHSATVRILATSREGLGVPDEQVRPVRSLDVAGGIDSAAVSLFVERAQGIAPGFSMVDGDEAAAVIEICQRLDGIPLAIELAASRMASMTASEMRDRFDHRFRLLVGSRRGLERRQTLRHAVAWSYDLLDDAEKTVLERCSVFAGGFDLKSACAIAGSDDIDEYAILDLLDALVRKSLLIADRSTGRTRFSMLETIRQFTEEQLVASGEATVVRPAHARYFAGRETDIMALWDSPRQRDAYDWFAAELANLRAAFRWAADQGDLDVAAPIATYAASLGVWVAQYEPVSWAEELIEPADVAEHRRLAHLYVLAAQCYAVGRVDDAVRHLEASWQLTKKRGFDEVPDEVLSSSGFVYSAAGQPERWADLCRSVIARGPGPHVIARACLVMALYQSGESDEARVASAGLLATADATENPNTACYALLAHGLAYLATDPVDAYGALRRALTIARESGDSWSWR